MKKPFLHSRIHKQLELGINTDEAAEALRKLGAVVDSSDVDAMPFVIEAEDYHIEGLIQRWEGTESRIRFEGELTLAPFNQTLRTRIVAVSAVFVVLAAFFFIIPWSIDFFGAEGFFKLYVAHFFVAAVIVIPLIAGIFRLASYDPLAKRRWDAQQALGEFAGAVQKMQDNRI
jgi:hypothetical protein